MIDAVTHKAANLLRATPNAAFSQGGSSYASIQEGVQGKEGNTKSVASEPTPLSPRLRYDSVSGIVITEFLDQAGGVQTQAPSNAVLAYLRAGLSADGTKQKAVEAPAKDQDKKEG
jgi:hypothetical protein